MTFPITSDSPLRFPGPPPAADTLARRIRDLLVKKLLACWRECADGDWQWFETSATYENARLCQALILSGQSIPHADALETGLESLRWLAAQQKAAAGVARHAI
jgi:hypothetical protein